ncbi:MAG: hypothetical protein M3Z27_10585 [Actinomycetota bacterium]|nr:hypothetical protein [Actinomycetota bacterium]
MAPPAPRFVLVALAALALTSCVALGHASSAAALNPLRAICHQPLAGTVVPACKVAGTGGKLLGAGKKLLTGHVGGAAKAALGAGTNLVGGLVGKAAFGVGLAAVGGWVLGGANAALKLTARLLDKSTRPQLRSTWFSSTYWRIAGISALLTLPFLFAATVQALLRSDLTLLARAALGYLPLSLLAVSLAAPLTMLLLSATDGISAVVTSAAGGASTRFLGRLGALSGGLSLVSSSPFVSFFVGILVVAAAVLLWVEMLMREAAIYIVVLMLPLVFAALVWPARRKWATRSVEILVALILSKFVVVSVLSLGAAALGQAGGGDVSGMLMGLVLVVLAAAAPWALMHLLPMAELATTAAGHMRGELSHLGGVQAMSGALAGGAGDWVGSLPSMMRRQADDVDRRASPEASAGSEAAKLDGGGLGADPDEALEGLRDGAAGDQEPASTGAQAGELAGDVVPAAGGRGASEPDGRRGTELTTSAPRDPGGDSGADSGATMGPSDLADGVAPNRWSLPEQATDRVGGALVLGSEMYGRRLPPSERDEGHDAAAGDEPDPLPPRQEPQEGRL